METNNAFRSSTYDNLTHNAFVLHKMVKTHLSLYSGELCVQRRDQLPEKNYLHDSEWESCATSSIC